MSLAETIKTARKSRGLTQEQLARLCDCDHSLISRYEAGLRPTPSVLVRLARELRLGLSLEQPVETGADHVA